MRISLTLLFLFIAATAQGQYGIKHYHDGYQNDFDDYSYGYDRGYHDDVIYAPTYIYIEASPLDYAQAQKIYYEMEVAQYEYRQQRSLAVQAERQERRDRYRSNYFARRDSGILYSPPVRSWPTKTTAVAAKPVAEKSSHRNNPDGSGWSVRWLQNLFD